MTNKKNALLWELKHPDVLHTSYLFGTTHVSDDRAYHMFEIVKSKLDHVTSYASEINLDELAQAGMPEYYLLKEGATVHGLLGESTFAKLRQTFLNHFGVDMEHYDQLLPFITLNALSVAALESQHSLPLDHALWEYAKSRGMKMKGLETPDEQSNFLKKIPLKLQLKMLRDAGKNVAKFRRNLNKMMDRYHRQEIHALYKTARKSIGNLKHIILYQRNENMVGRLDNFHKHNSIFAAIGVGHLVGKSGMLRLLKGKGYKTKPVWS